MLSTRARTPSVISRVAGIDGGAPGAWAVVLRSPREAQEDYCVNH